MQDEARPGLRFGMFLPPIHAPDENPTLALRRDAELIGHLDRLGYDEVWVGEHHSTGWEFIGSPEVFIAHVAAQTTRIGLGTGVISLPYHHPLMVAERLVLLDHLTQGRLLFGAGPGAQAADALAMGFEAAQARPRMEQALEAIMALLRGERVTRETEWFTLRDATLQLRPYSVPCFESAVAATHSPSGPRLAGRLGTSMLSLNAATSAGYSVLGEQWPIVEEEAALHGHTVDRRNWRVVGGPIHIAATEKQAWEDIEYGIEKWLHYTTEVAATESFPQGSPRDATNALVESGAAVIGTPAQAIAQIERLLETSGGFGTFLTMAHDWASAEATIRSYELLARHVFPAFQHTTQTLADAADFARENRARLLADVKSARMQATDAYAAERAARS